MQWLKCLVVVGALPLVVGMVEAGPAAAAKGGNNDTSNACQQGGWQTLVAQTGDDFKNAGDCINDGAQAVAPFGTHGKAACDAIPGGQFSAGPASWTCSYPNNQYTGSLLNACNIDANDPSGGSFQTSSNGIGLEGTCQAGGGGGGGV
jgi:hypothetical protein